MLLGQWKTYFYHEKALHGVKVTVWPAISSTEVIGLFFFEDENGETQRVNSVHYLDIKKNVIIDQKDVIRSKIFEFVVSFFKQIHCVKIIIKISWVKIYGIHVYIIKMHILFCSINLARSYSKSKQYQLVCDNLNINELLNTYSSLSGPLLFLCILIKK